MLKRLFLLLLLIPTLSSADTIVDGKHSLGAATVSTLTATGSVTENSTVTHTVTNTTATSGNVNELDGEFHVNAASASTAVYAGVLGNCYTDSTSATVSSPGHTICVFGYNHVNHNQDLAIASEGKLIIDVTGVTVGSGASVHCGLADITSGSTITNWTGCNSVITANHGTISTAKGFDFGITASSLIGNVFAYNAQDVSASIATNYGGFRCQVNSATAHFCLYEDGTAQNAITGNTYIGATADNGSGAKLQVTGTSTTSVHSLSVGSAPTISSGCGTSPSIAGRDEAMTITVGTGGSATSCTIAFATSFTTNAPSCVAISNSDTGLLMTTATNGLTVSKATALTAGSKIMVVCRGWL